MVGSAIAWPRYHETTQNCTFGFVFFDDTAESKSFWQVSWLTTRVSGFLR